MGQKKGIDVFEHLALKAENLKCFREPAGFDQIQLFNVVIGRNNVGKSTLIDLVQYAITGGRHEAIPGYLNRTPNLYAEAKIDKKLIDHFITPGYRGTRFQGAESFPDWCTKYILGQKIAFGLLDHNESRDSADAKMNKVREYLDIKFPNNFSLKQQFEEIYKVLLKEIKNPFAHYQFRRLIADRDVRPEGISLPNASLEELHPNGQGATALIARYINHAHLDRDIIEVLIKNELNKIFNPDTHVNRIVPRQRFDGNWEIYLEEPYKGLVPMSLTGSGMKTILLVLLNLYLIPDLMRRNHGSNISLNEIIFGFEELENNLHPALQRRLFLYLQNVAKKEGCRFFVTTHSHVVIDVFSREPDAQIIHVTHNGECARAQCVTTYVGHKNIFEDLEVRASDLLQTNCVVWVEGPSDRIYFNKWIDIWTNGELKEHIDYEVCFSGGTLLAHYTYDNSTQEHERIEALRINRNAIVLMDSDKKSSKRVGKG